MTEFRPPSPPRVITRGPNMIEARLRHGFPPSLHTVQIHKTTGQVMGGNTGYNGVIYYYLLAAARNHQNNINQNG